MLVQNTVRENMHIKPCSCFALMYPLAAVRVAFLSSIYRFFEAGLWAQVVEAETQKLLLVVAVLVAGSLVGQKNTKGVKGINPHRAGVVFKEPFEILFAG